MNYPIVKAECDRTWMKYCGFLDLSVEQFMSIQETLLFQQMETMSPSGLGRKLFGSRAPTSLREFRNSVPLTRYSDYLPELDRGDDGVLPEKPYAWATTLGANGTSKRVPYSNRAFQKTLDNLMTVFILACSDHRGQSTIAEGDRILFNVAPKPYISGLVAAGAAEQFNFKTVLPPDTHDALEFKEKLKESFESSVRTGMDVLVAMTSVLVKTGSEFKERSRTNRSMKHFVHPAEAYRITRAVIRSRLEGRAMLPKDIWSPKAIIGWGSDTDIFSDLVHEYWGAYPYRFHACTEAGIIAVQSWTRKAMTLIPQSNFYEFIPEAEWIRSRNDLFYEPRTVLLSEVQPDQRYELVVTSFFGMPFVRYRLGHLVRVTASADDEAGIQLPQVVFEARADDLIDIGGFTRISENTVAHAIAGAGLEYDDWTIRRETIGGAPAIHLYIELRRDYGAADLSSVLHGELAKVDQGYRDLTAMLGIHPLRVTALAPGSFRDFRKGRQDCGIEISQQRPPRINASDEVIRELTGLESRRVLDVTPI